MVGRPSAAAFLRALVEGRLRAGGGPIELDAIEEADLGACALFLVSSEKETLLPLLVGDVMVRLDLVRMDLGGRPARD